jgi:hypothetical protein
MDNLVSKLFFQAVLEEARQRHLLSNQHFTVDGTLLESWGRSAIDGRTVKRVGYALSQRMRKRIEEIFGWWKTVGGGRRLRFIGRRRNQLWVEMTGAAFNLVRMSNLVSRPA